MALTAIAGISLNAQTTDFAPVNLDQKLANLKPANPANIISRGGGTLQELTPHDMMTVQKSWNLSDAGRKVLTTQASTYAPKAHTRSAATWEDFLGEWVMTYDTPLTTSTPGGCSVKITRNGETNKVIIENFWRAGTKINATVDPATGTISIAYQYITNGSYGKVNMGAVARETGAWLRNDKVIGQLQADGSIAFDTWWALFVTEGEDAGMYLDAYYMTKLRRGNSTMKHTKMTVNKTDTTYTHLVYPVITKQISSNIVSVVNFGDCGQDVEITLNPDKSAVIPSQLVYWPSLNMKYMSASHIVLNANGNAVESYDNNINIAPSGKDNELEWTDWSAMTRSYWMGFLLNTKITFGENLKFPTSNPVTAFEGEGTQASPYLLKSLNDLRYLSDEVNNAAFNAQSTNSDGETVRYARVYQNTYFKLANDIDMADYRFTPIGADGFHYFCGKLDGNGHTIKNLTVVGGSDIYAALIGTLDGTGSIKNLTVENADIKSDNTYAAVLVSDALGTIDNCHIKNSKVNSSALGGALLCAYSQGASNCSVENCELYVANGYAGSIAAISDGNITDCHAINTNISGANSSGYLYPVGGIAAKYQGKIERCYYTGTIDYCPSTAYGPVIIGGIAGQPTTTSQINDCFAAATLRNGRHNMARTGGIVGVGVPYITNCHFAGHIDSPSSYFNGGMCGQVQSAIDQQNNEYLARFTNCYSVITMRTGIDAAGQQTQMAAIGASDPNKRPIIQNVYFDNQISNLDGEFGLSTSAMTAAAGPKGFDAAHWTFNAGTYPIVKTFETTPAAQLAASAIVIPAHTKLSQLTADAAFNSLGATKLGFIVEGKIVDNGRFASSQNNMLKLNSELKFGRDTIVIYNGDMSIFHTACMLPIPMQGTGSETDPYLVKTKDDLLALATMTSEYQLSFPDMYFKMTNDIDMEYDKRFKGLSSTHTSAVTFNSVFDGGGHTIHKMAIDSITWNVHPEDDPAGFGTVNTTTSAYNETFAGFIGILGNSGVLKNLNIAADCRFQVFASCGALAGWNNGLIENCRNYADIKGISMWNGGLVGQNQNTGIIRNCVNTGNLINGNRNAGGITSRNNGLIENCINIGNVSIDEGAYQKAGKNSLTNAGGLAGSQYGGRIINCQNFGNVYAREGIVGGLLGENGTGSTSSSLYSNDIINSTNFGVVTSGNPLTAGQISGKGGSTGQISAVFDSQLSGLGAEANAATAGMSGLTTRQLVAGTPVEGLAADKYTFAAGKYPVLTQFANEDAVQKAAEMVVIFADGDIATNISKPAALAQANGLTWALTAGTAFKVNGNTLSVPEVLTTLLSDTLVATNGKISKAIYLMGIPPVPLKGAGSENDPYLLTSADEWNSMADFMAATDSSFMGCFIKIANDIDFAGKQFKPMGIDPTYFRATLDGDNHTVKGIDFTAEGQYVGAFGVLDAMSTVKNLTLEGKIANTIPAGASTSYSSYIGGFAGKAYGLIENCVNKLAVSTEKTYAAGFAGETYDGARFVKCVNRGTIKASGYIGGIVANGKNATGDLSFTDCANEGTLHSTGTTSSYSGYVGGIVAKTVEAKFIRCYNTGEIKADRTDMASNMAGIVGYLAGTKGNPYCVFEECYNTADITGNGGLAGIVAYTASTVGASRMQMTGCYNKGNLTAIATSTSAKPAAGILANITPGSMIQDCWNEGNIVSNKTSGPGGIAGTPAGVPTKDFPTYIMNCYNKGNISNTNGEMASGIIATLQAFTYVNECYNLGTITGKSKAAGISANNYGSNGEINDCFNLGDVTVDTYRAGGIVAHPANNGGAETKINNCWNAGTIRSLSTITGNVVTSGKESGFAIGGIAGHTKAQLTNCANFGEVIGADMVGGLVGMSYKGTTAKAPNTCLTNCYNAGKVTAQEGGHASNTVVKHAFSTKVADGGWNDQFNVLKNVMYVTDNGTFADSESGTATTIAELAKTDLGAEWTSADDASLPMPESHYDWDAARLHSAAVVLAEGDSRNSVTRSFKVGNPKGIKWTASVPALSIEGNDATWTATYEGEVELTATIGDFSKTVKVTANVTTTGIDSVTSEAGKDVVSEAYFTTSGLEVAKPTAADGQIYIVVFTYSDGSVSTVKLINK